MSQSQGASAPDYCTPNLFYITQALWERAADHLTQDELEWFSGSLEQAEFLAGKLTDVIAEIGCFISNDTDNGGKVPLGSYQSPGDISGLLFFINDALLCVRTLILVGDSATHRLLKPEIYSGNRKGGPAVQSRG